jgi:membrane associated rhomboid family serine protease
MLLIANVVVFLAQKFGGDRFLVTNFALQPVALWTNFAVWQVVTHLFLHGDVWHILLNMFGGELEETWGRDRFLSFYFFCGIGAALCVILSSIPFGETAVRTIGASGAVYGILLASAVLWPDRIVVFMMMFPMKMKYMVMIYGAISFIGTLEPGSGVSHFAHLGGMLFAWIYMKTPAVRGVRGFNPLSSVQQQYKAWKLARNKRRFQVYMKKQGDKKDPWVN